MFPLLGSVAKPKNLKIQRCCKVTELEGANDPSGMKIPLVTNMTGNEFQTFVFSGFSFNGRLYVFRQCIQQFAGDKIMADSAQVLSKFNMKQIFAKRSMENIFINVHLLWKGLQRCWSFLVQVFRD